MKKSLFFLFGILVSALLGAGTAFADGVSVRAAGGVAACPGQTVTVPVSIAGIPASGVAGFEAGVSVEGSLSIEGIARGEAVTAGSFEANPATGRVAVASSGAAIPADGVLFTVSVAVPALRHFVATHE